MFKSNPDPTTSSLLPSSSNTSLTTSPPTTPIANPKPRTTARVHFALDSDSDAVIEDISVSERRAASEDDVDDDRYNNDARWVEGEDYMQFNGDEYDEEDYGDAENGRRLPLLTGITPPRIVRGNELAMEELLEEQERPKSGMRMAFMNMANSIIGAGIIGMPYSFRQAGLGMGIILLLVLTIIVDWTIQLIAINTKLSGTDSFQATMQHCFGKSGLVAISVAQWAFAFGGCIAYCIIIGDTFPHVMTALFPGIENVPVLNLLANRRAAIVIFTLGISYPLTLYRDISKLAKASAFALVSMAIIVFTVIVQGISIPASERPDTTNDPIKLFNTGLFQAVGVISFAFVCHHNSLLIYASLKTPTLNRFATVTHYSTGISMLFCILMACAGYLTFRSTTSANVLNNFSSTNTMANIARLCFGFNMLTTLPLEAFVCREVMEEYYFPGESFNYARHLILSTALVVSALSVSLITCDLGAVFELIGATSACALAYVLPAVCYIKLATRSWRTWAAVVVAMFGGAVMVISLAQSFWKMARDDGTPAQCRW